MDFSITGCSIGCLYAEGGLSFCQCVCAGAKHGLLASKPQPVHGDCTPAAAKKCKSGEEGGECRCACGGINHGLYASAPEFEEVRITGLVQTV